MLSDDLSDEVVDLLERLLCKDPKYRLGSKNVNEIKDHIWFKDVDWKTVADGKQDMPTPYLRTRIEEGIRSNHKRESIQIKSKNPRNFQISRKELKNRKKLREYNEMIDEPSLIDNRISCWSLN